MGLIKPKFPDNVWDGLTPTRKNRLDTREPDNHDWDQITAELIATQRYIVGMSSGSSDNLASITDQEIARSNLGLGSIATHDATDYLLNTTYDDPAWLTSLDAAKLTGSIVATNGVVTTGTYTDPAWLTSLNVSKLTGTASNPSWVTTLSSTKVTYDPTTSGLTSTTIDAAVSELNTLIAGQHGTKLISGGGFIWVDNYNFRLSASTFYLDNKLYTSTEQTVTLTASDPSNNRFDYLIWDVSSGTPVANKVTGTASSTPAIPSIDPSTQFPITPVRVDAGTTAPTQITSTVIYDEGIEWTATTSGTGWTLNSTNSPSSGTKCIEATSVSTGYVQLASTAIDPTSQSSLTFKIKPKAAFSKRSLTLGFYSNGTLKGSLVTLKDGAYSFSSSNTNYQLVVIPISDFAVPSGTSINQIRCNIAGSGSGIGFYLDTLILQAGSSVDNSQLDLTQLDARYARTAASNVFTKQQSFAPPSGEAAISITPNGANAINVNNAFVVDVNGYSLIAKAVFLLGKGSDLANGTDIADGGDIAVSNGKLWKWKLKAKSNAGGFTFDIKQAGTSIFSAPIAIASGVTTVQSGNTFASSTVTENNQFTVDISSAGAGVQNVILELYYLVKNN